MNKIKDIFYFFIALIYSSIRKLCKKEDIWLITERRDQCKDNGYYLFKYIRENHSSLKVYYVIDKKSEELKKIKDFKNIIVFNSLKHYIYSLCASKLIGAFLPCGIPDSLCFYKFSNLIKGKKVFLQHGITKEYIPSLTYANSKVDMFCCAVEDEYNYIINTFGYPKDNVKLTGFCRFDGLKNNDSNVILIMPTWRKWIPSVTWNKGFKDFIIEKEEYFVKYKNLLEKLSTNRQIDISNYRVIFYLHHEFQCYKKFFKSLNLHSNIVIANDKEYDVQNLLIQSKILITDYSSVAFDFAYMKKPLIYFQFNQNRYNTNHYLKGYFDFENDGFGKVCYFEEDVIEELNSAVLCGFQLSDFYNKRVLDFFLYNDDKNSERVFLEIKNLENVKK